MSAAPHSSPLLIASTNPGKRREIALILAGLPIELLSLADLPDILEPDETGATFAENARLKARYYSRAAGLSVVAEDSGLVIDALEGEPGVHSARYGGASAPDYPARFSLIHEKLRARGLDTSPARFICALAVASGDRILFEAEGCVEGTIASEPRGAGGFGYDPLLYYPPYRRTLAEVSDEEKAAVSHRGRAFRKLREFLASAQATRC